MSVAISWELSLFAHPFADPAALSGAASLGEWTVFSDSVPAAPPPRLGVAPWFATTLRRRVADPDAFFRSVASSGRPFSGVVLVGHNPPTALPWPWPTEIVEVALHRGLDRRLIGRVRDAIDRLTHTDEELF